MPAPPANWGQGEGLFFGNRRLYSEVFATVSNGGPKREGKVAMPSWKNILAREQIWALLYFLEFQSGGIEGQVPAQPLPADEDRGRAVAARGGRPGHQTATRSGVSRAVAPRCGSRRRATAPRRS